MEALELNTLNDLKTALNLTDNQAIHVIEIFKKLQKDNSDYLIIEIKSLFKEDFHRLELKLEQQNTKFEQFNTKLEQNKVDILKSFLAGLITIIGMILALIATVIFRH